MEREYFQFYDGEKVGIKTTEGKVIIPAIYDFVGPYSGGLFNVTNAGAHAYFDLNGKIILPFQDKYESYGNFTEGIARVKINDKWGYIDKAGQEIIKPQFHFAEEFSNEIAVVRNTEGKYGAIDKTGKIIIDYQFRVLTKFENGYAKFGDFKTYGLIDNFGKIVVPQEFISIGSVDSGRVKIQIKEGEKYREGILTLGGPIEWNNNLTKVNEFNRKREEFVLLSEELIRTMYSEGCPCQYERFRSFIQWDKPIIFFDQEELFDIFSKQLEKENDDSFRCKSCGTTYKRSWEEYSIALQVIKIEITKIGNFKEKGAKVESITPVTLGFRGYDLDKLKKTYKQTDNETVILYLEEKAGTNSSLPKARPTWWKNFWLQVKICSGLTNVASKATI